MWWKLSRLYFLAIFALPWVADAADLVIRNVTVVDVATGAELPKRSVLIHNKQIAALGIDVKVPKNAAVVNGAGKYLIPGLWDMHVHLWYRENQFPLFLANGITGVRDMGSDLNWVNQWRDEIKANKLLGPRIETSGPAVDGSASQDPKLPVFVVRTAYDGRATFDRLDNLDVDFISVLPNTPRDAYFALIERARKYWLAVAGPVPWTVSRSEAIDARQKSFEHMSGLLLACSKNEDRLRRKEIVALEKQDWNAWTDVHAEALDSFDPKKASNLFERMATYDVREVPSLVSLRRNMFADADALASSTYAQYIPAAIRKTWTDPREERKKIDARRLEIANAEYEKLRDLLPVMKKAHVMIMAGTDTGGSYTFPGYDLHKELELLVEAGLTPLEALRSATLEPAKYLEATDYFGTITVGKEADLVMLDADPLKDIRNTSKIDAVFVDGTYLSKARLNAMLAAVKRR